MSFNSRLGWMVALVLIAGWLTAVPVTYGAAQTTAQYEVPFTDTDRAFSGTTSVKQEYFQIEDYWNVSQVQINLDYKASQLTQGTQSSITMLLNGKNFYSFRPVTNDQASQHLTVTLPKAWLVKGSNTLTLQGRMESTLSENVCPPQDSLDSWFQLYDTSAVVVSYQSLTTTDSIADFSRHFVGRDTMQNAWNAVSVPAKADPAELEAGIYALSGYASQNPLKDKNIPLVPMDTAGLKVKKTVIMVAKPSHLPAEIQSSLSSADLKGTDLGQAALIKVMHYAGQTVMVVTSDNDDLLRKAGKWLANAQLVRQVKGSSKFIQANTDTASPAVPISSRISLTENGSKLTGEGHQEQAFFISLPANRSLASGSKISMNFRYAQNLDFQRSMVTLLVNGTPIGSKKLSSQMADGDTLTLTLPENLNVSGNFTVTAAFDLEMTDAPCTVRSSEQPWAFISPDSLLQLNTKDRNELLFNDYPYPFLRDGAYNKIAVVLPADPDEYTIRALSNVFNLLGQYMQSNAGDVRVYSDNVSDAELGNAQIIAIGGYTSNKLIRENNDHLYFRYDSKGAAFVSNEKMSLDPDYGQRIGALQLISSPYSDGNGLLAVTGASSESVYLASKLIASDTARYKVFGDAVITDKDGVIQAFRFKKEAGSSSDAIGTRLLQRTDVLSFTAVAVMLLVLVLVSLIFMIRKYRKRRREEP
ncbi:cellulose biosynthesis cyclic di-GMP-binding regulatory protein BcsB [Paenibacillus sp. JX-17]|uniref:Cellulose biosynthesis cyclic di-GMP-binding regulatory protein BcsB n=1 Tax=Paenibacillus lacisoli TaxID=3064525 RepID=A0ABT9CGM2_9BACL|nr:cellulose biosynthesis cyclic di-GMP-binding regulatory protein BcsB [Paenibacillus sp. JX-17]MDO7908050.1 cellulose biosynthesis cyclic di-GMP-binding regulatory protein BcsB [Paenibacillus sp. JX-17]